MQELHPEIKKTLDLLIDIAEQTNELPLAGILLTYMGARIMGDDRILFDAVLKCNRETLLPLALQAKHDNHAIKN